MVPTIEDAKWQIDATIAEEFGLVREEVKCLTEKLKRIDKEMNLAIPQRDDRTALEANCEKKQDLVLYALQDA